MCRVLNGQMRLQHYGLNNAEGIQIQLRLRLRGGGSVEASLWPHSADCSDRRRDLAQGEYDVFATVNATIPVMAQDP